MDDIGGSTLVTDNIKLWKQSSDDGSNEIWIGLDNTATVDKSGLDQGHIVGVSIQKDGKAIKNKLMCASSIEWTYSLSCCRRLR